MEKVLRVDELNISVVLLLLLLRVHWLGRRTGCLLLQLLLRLLLPEGAGGPIQSGAEGGEVGAEVKTGTEENEGADDEGDKHK